MTDTQAVREKLESERDRVGALIGRIQGGERRETARGQTDTAHLREDAEISGGELGDLTAESDGILGALQRLDVGSYGVCVSCGQPIPEARLEVLPAATTCIACAEK
jgi:RNA polymerase-binding transcription factor DksA